MFTGFKNIFTSKPKKRSTNTHIKKSHYSIEDIKKSSFKKRKKGLLSAGVLQGIPTFRGNKKTFLIIILGVLCILTGIFIFFSSFFKINEVYIFRQDSIINIDQAYGNIDYIRGKNILFLNTNEIVLSLQKSQKSIANIEFDVDFPNKINIHIGSYPALFQTQKHLILSNGVVVSKDEKKYIGIPFLQISQDIDEYAVFGKALNVENLKNLDILIQEIKKNILGFDFEHMKYYITQKELLILHNSGSIFIFDLNSDDMLSQIEKLAIYEKEKGNIYEKKYLYVDARIPEKLFLCPLESQFNCKQNITNIYGDSIFKEFSGESLEPLQ